MERVVGIFETEMSDLESEINQEITKLKKQGCKILNVSFGGRSNSYRRDWGALILFDDGK